MLVTFILCVAMGIVNATASSNQLRAQKMLHRHLARAGNRPA
jgi:hypothetical protein